MGDNVIPHNHEVKLSDRSEKLGYNPQLIWFTGLSGSGKSTLANELEKKLFELGYHTYILDGDNIRTGLNKDLDFSDKGRVENIRRISEVSKLFVDAGTIVLTAFISPFKEDRATARKMVGDQHFTEVFVDCPLEICEKRDVKGLYAKARNGEIPFFTGITSPFEEPDHAEVVVKTAEMDINEGVQQLLSHIIPKIKLNK